MKKFKKYILFSLLILLFLSQIGNTLAKITMNDWLWPSCKRSIFYSLYRSDYFLYFTIFIELVFLFVILKRKINFKFKYIFYFLLIAFSFLFNYVTKLLFFLTEQYIYKNWLERCSDFVQNYLHYYFIQFFKSLLFI